MRTLVVLLAAWASFAAYAAQSSEQDQFDFANGLFRRAMYSEAVTEYTHYIEQFPQGEFVLQAQYRLGEAAYAVGDYTTALASFEKALTGKPDETMRQKSMLRKGELLSRLGKRDEAIPLLTELSISTTDAEIKAGALYYLGKAQVEGGDFAAATSSLKKLLEEAPTSPLVPYARYQLAFAYLAAGEPGNAATEFTAVASSDADDVLKNECRFKAAETYAQLTWHDAAATAYKQLLDEFPDSPYTDKAVYGFAWSLYYSGKYEEAVKAASEYESKFADKSGVVGMMYLRANSQQQQKQYDDAIDVYRKISRDHANSEFARKALYKVAWTLYLNEKFEEAKTEVQSLLANRDDTPLTGDASFLLGALLSREGKFAEAYQEFGQVAEKYQTSEFAPEALFRAGECLVALKRIDEATRVFESFVKSYPDHLLAEQALLKAGDSQFFSAAFKEAIEKYKSILASSPDPHMEEEALHRLGVTYHNMQDYASSTEIFQTLLTKYPSGAHTGEALLRIGDHLLRDGKNPVEAMAKYQAAYDAAPTGAFAGQALRGLALARFETKDYDGATDSFLRVVKEFPDTKLNEGAYAWIGQYLFDQKKYDLAALALEAMLKGVPDYPNPERLRFKIAECAESAGKSDDALTLYAKVVEMAPETSVAVDAQFRLAKLFEAKNDMEKAIAYYEAAANTNTGDTAAFARFRLGELSEAKGDYVGAARSFMRIAILYLHETLSPESLWRAAQCYEKAQSLDQAKKAYQELLSDFPESEQAAKAKQRLTELG